MREDNKAIRLVDLRDFFLFGHCEAYILQQIKIWAELSKRTPEEGTYRTLADWVIDLPFYGKSSIHNSLQKLMKEGVININSEPGKPNNRRTWYSINVDILEAKRSTVTVPYLTDKTTQEAEKLYFNHSIEESNLYRIALAVSQNLGYKSIDDCDVVSYQLEGVSQNLRHRTYLYIIIYTKTILRLIADNLKNDKLEFDGLWKIFRKTNKRNMPNKAKMKAAWSKWSQAQRDRFIPRLADHLLDQYLKNDYLFWAPTPSQYFTCGLQSKTTGFQAVWLQTEHPLGSTPDETMETYDERLIAKLKSFESAGENRQITNSTNVHELHAGFKHKKQVAGFDPTLG